MPLLAPSVIASLSASLSGHGFLGISAPLLSSAIGNGFSSYMSSSPIVKTGDTGTAGVGAGLGQGLILSSVAISAALRSSLTANGIIGVARERLIAAVSLALSSSLLAAGIVTVSAGVGIGTGVVDSVIPFPAVSIPAMIGSFASFGIAGSLSPRLATAIAQGIDSALPSAKGFVVISGPPSLSASRGIGTGKLV